MNIKRRKDHEKRGLDKRQKGEEYQPPRLVRYGTLKELTAAKVTGAADGRVMMGVDS